MALLLFLQKKMNKKGLFNAEPINIIMASVAMLGSVLIFIGKGDFGLIALIIATLFEAMSRVVR